MSPEFFKLLSSIVTKENITIIILAAIIGVLLWRNAKLHDKYSDLAVSVTKSLTELKHVIELLNERLK